MSSVQIKPVQKQTRAGQRTRFKAIVIIGDSEGHVGLGIKTSKEVATAIRAAIIIAKLSVIPVRRGYWGANLGLPHSLPTKESGKCGSVTVRVSPEDEESCGLNFCLLTWYSAYPCPPRYLPRRVPCGQASAPARWYRRCLHFVVRLDQDSREHSQGYFRRCLQHIRFPYPQSVEGDKAYPQPSRGVCGFFEGRQALCQLRVLLRVMLTQQGWKFKASMDLYLHGLRQWHRLRRANTK